MILIDKESSWESKKQDVLKHCSEDLLSKIEPAIKDFFTKVVSISETRHNSLKDIPMDIRFKPDFKNGNMDIMFLGKVNDSIENFTSQLQKMKVDSNKIDLLKGKTFSIASKCLDEHNISRGIFPGGKSR